MPTVTEKKQVKVFDRVAFEKVKKLQSQKKQLSRKEIAERVGFGEETIRKAMKAPNWPQYRKNEISRSRQRKLQREEGRQMRELYPKGMLDNDEPFLPAPGEGNMSKGFKVLKPKATDLVNNHKAAGIVAILIVALVLFLIVR